MLFGQKKKERVKVAKEMAVAERAFRESEEMAVRKTAEFLLAFKEDFRKKHWRIEDV